MGHFRAWLVYLIWFLLLPVLLAAVVLSITLFKVADYYMWATYNAPPEQHIVFTLDGRNLPGVVPKEDFYFRNRINSRGDFFHLLYNCFSDGLYSKCKDRIRLDVYGKSYRNSASSEIKRVDVYSTFFAFLFFPIILAIFFRRDFIINKKNPGRGIGKGFLLGYLYACLYLFGAYFWQGFTIFPDLDSIIFYIIPILFSPMVFLVIFARGKEE